MATDSDTAMVHRSVEAAARRLVWLIPYARDARPATVVRVYVVEPGKPGRVLEVDGSVEAMQRLVDGPISTVGTLRIQGVAIVFNRNTLLPCTCSDFAPNREGLYGTFFFVRYDPPDFSTLTDEDIATLSATYGDH